MVDKLLLDEDTVYAFRGMYPGEITECVDATHISYGGFFNKKPAALVVLRVEDHELFLDWLYAMPEIRKSGVMSELLQKVLDDCEYTGMYDIIRVICPGDELKHFLGDLSFEFEAEPVGYSYITEIEKMRDLSAGKHPTEASRLEDLSKYELNILNNTLDGAKNLAYSVPLPVSPDRYSDMSRVSIRDERLNAVLLLKQEQEDIVDISYAYKSAGAEIPLIHMIMNVRDEIKKKIPMGGRIRSVALNDSSEALFEGLFPNGKKEPVYSGTRFIF